MSQKNTFLETEGDAWFVRNKQAVSTRKLPDDDPLICEILDININAGTKILEVGCGDGTRLAWLKHNVNADCYGIEPSPQAVEAACAKGLSVLQGTADKLPWDDQSFDIVIFGFCLYLCDREDLFRIASEADRVLRAPGWLLIKDFFSPVPYAKAYHHNLGIKTYKMDYRTLFDWHPDYECISHKVRHHGKANHTDEQDEWVAVSAIRKHRKDLGT